MTPRLLIELATRLGATLCADGEALVQGFATDSRYVRPGDLFLAIKGERVDGHDFVATAKASGAAACLVERPVAAPYLLVDSVVHALARMASSFRDEFAGPVVGITGSVGKTTAKELVAAALTPLGPVLKSPGNRNTEYTSPLVWADLDAKHRTAVIEMGMRGFGQIAHLASFSRPSIAVITNIGYAHLELVGTREGIARAKGELLQALPSDGAAILWHGDDFLAELREMSPSRTSTYGFEPEADCTIAEYRPSPDRASVTLAGDCYGELWQAQIPNIGRHAAVSAAAAVLAAVECGASAASAASALSNVQFEPMRMQATVREDVYVLVDTYNASPPSMVAALEFLCEHPTRGKRLAVIGEMRELGEYAEEAHRRLGHVPALRELDAILFFGAPTRATLVAALEAGVPEDRLSMASTIDDVRAFVGSAKPGDAILIKGSRALELERALE